MPSVRPAPLSAWTLVGMSIGVAPALGQHLLLPCWAAGRRRHCGKRFAAWRQNSRLKPNSIITGTGPLASAGVVSVSWISTVMCGSAELSTWPTSFLVMTATSPFFSCVVLTTSHLTLGSFCGTRP